MLEQKILNGLKEKIFNVSNLISKFGPNNLYTHLKTGKAHLDDLIYGVSLLPYELVYVNLSSNILNFDPDLSLRDDVKNRFISDPVTSCIAYPLLEEILFRVVPFYVGKSLGGERGGKIGISISAVLFAMGHIPNYKDSGPEAFTVHLGASLFYILAYLKGGLLSSFALHSSNNSLAYFIS